MPNNYSLIIEKCDSNSGGGGIWKSSPGEFSL